MNYLQPHTVGSLIGGSFTVYFRNWLTFFLICILPLFPVYLLQVLVIQSYGESSWLMTVLVVVDSVITLVLTIPATVAVSEVCLGIKPKVSRAFRKGFLPVGRVVGTVLLSIAIILFGFLALTVPAFVFLPWYMIVPLAVPGFVFFAWYMFVPPVVVMESLGGIAALRRSRELGRGYYLRNLGVFVLLLLLVIFIASFLTFLFGVLAGILNYGEEWLDRFGGVVFSAAYMLAAPSFSVANVLLYYDMRARKEGYGATQLAEDMRF